MFHGMFKAVFHGISFRNEMGNEIGTNQYPERIRNESLLKQAISFRPKFVRSAFRSAPSERQS